MTAPLPDDSVFEYHSRRPTGNRIGVAFSGGGIRSAAFSLGGLQALQHADIMERVRYLSAVSGGSYTAAAYVSSLAARNAGPDRKLAGPRVWSPGGPEEAYLLRNLGYLARGLKGRAWFLTNVVFGVILNLLPLLFGSFLVGRLLGYGIYDRLHPSLEHGSLNGSTVVASIGISLVFVGLSLCLVVRRRFTNGARNSNEARANESAMTMSAWLLALALCTLGGGIALPGAAAVLHRWMAQVGVSTGAIEGPEWLTGRAEACLLLISASLALGVIALGLLRTGRLRWLATILSGISGPLLLLTPCILAVESSAVRSWSTHRDLPLIVVGIGVLTAFGFGIHNRIYSMHNFYRERLSEAFFLERTMATAPPAARMVPYSNRILLSDMQNTADQDEEDMPTLLIGAAVNASDKSVGFGTGAESFVFGPKFSGSRKVGRAATPELERKQVDEGSDLTLPAMVAISGAALSPVMGRLTVSSFRFLLALLNVRLGVWVRSPRGPSPRTEGTLPIPGVLSRTDARCAQWGWYSTLKRGWLEPGAYYVLKEALGRTSLNSRFLYVTDGGHWENLGLYELARRRCTHIVVFDATNNPISPLADFGRCCQLMFSRLGITVQLDASSENLDAPDLADGPPIGVGKIIYPDAPAGTLIVCRTALWKTAPLELRLYAKSESRFPRHSTGNQFLTADQFDAYRRLGYELGTEAAVALGRSLPPRESDERPDGRPPLDAGLRYTVVG